mgnify:CR=1 FL=1
MATSSTGFDTTLNNLGIARSSTTKTNSNSSLGDRTLGQADFLSLMTAQMKNQDPFNPVDNTQMVAQMAQFSSVAGISEMNTTLKGLADKMAGSSTADALAYVGKTVLTEGSVAYGRTSGGLAGSIDLGGDATNVLVSITDAQGGTMKTMDLGAHSAGTVDYDWNGMNTDGENGGTGPFTISVTAYNGSANVAAKSLVWAPVESVSMPSGGSPKLTVSGLGQIDPSAVRSAG